VSGSGLVHVLGRGVLHKEKPLIAGGGQPALPSSMICYATLGLDKHTETYYYS
jgi:hypothetical protein